MNGRVFVLGNAGLDLSIRLPRLPRPGETLVGDRFTRAPGGKGLNQAVMAARCGVTVAFCAPLGQDRDGDEVAAVLARERFWSLDLPRLTEATDLSVIAVAPDGENSILSAGRCADALSLACAEAFAGRAGPGDVLLLQGNLGLDATWLAVRVATERGARVVLNTAPLRWPVGEVVAVCWAVIANETEAEALAGARRPAILVTTLGARGCCVNGERFPALPADAVDTTGAGDAFCGVFAAAVAAGLTVEAAVANAQRAAADTVTRPGAYAALPLAVELRG